MIFVNANIIYNHLVVIVILAYEDIRRTFSYLKFFYVLEKLKLLASREREIIFNDCISILH